MDLLIIYTHKLKTSNFGDLGNKLKQMLCSINYKYNFRNLIYIVYHMNFSLAFDVKMNILGVYLIYIFANRLYIIDFIYEKP